MNESERYIRTVVEGLYKGRHSGAYGYLLQHGREFGPRRYPRAVHQGAPKQCYMNAANLATRNPEYFYAEGMALAIIPVDHAWCVDREGRVIDPTWEPGTGSDYFGVKFPRAKLNQILMATEEFGVFPNWYKIERLMVKARSGPV